MAKKTASRTESPLPIPDPETRPSSADLSMAVAKLIDTGKLDNGQIESKAAGAVPLADASVQDDGLAVQPNSDASAVPKPAVPTDGGHSDGIPALTASSGSSSLRPSTETPPDSELFRSPKTSANDQGGASGGGPERDDITQPQVKNQEDLHVYIERIDALQAKLQYLSREAVESARQAAASAQPGSADRKLSEKDEKIALLMEEGQKLSKAEMNHLATIKKLRAQAVASNKDHDALRTRAEKAERSLTSMEERAKRAEAASKRAEQNISTNLAYTSDLEALRKERNALQTTVADMKSQLTRANARAEAAENKARSDQFEKERRRETELQDDLTSAKVERELAEEKLQREIKDLKASLEREKEHSRAMENEMLGEQATLESKLEAFRVRAEEASSADHGDIQAKLLRQIETLQSQYAAASQNWQGIEGTLLSRITNLEKERNDLATREADLRKKLREATLRAKHAERQLEEVQNRCMETEKSETDAQAEIQRLSRRAQQLESDLTKALKTLDEQKINSEREMQRRIDEEKTRWSASIQIQRTESPSTSIRKNSNLGFDMNHLMSPISYERGTSRRPSLLHGHDSYTPPRQHSTPSFRALANGSIAEAPSVITSIDQDEYFANVPPTPASQSHNVSHRGLNDLVSTSTVGAGPSVQLVERMSANVRRLESEKAAAKDELARLTTQRDESRQEVVSLMREVDEKRKIEERLTALEKEHQSLNERHQTSLELLGEKSEQVEELKADIADVKQMYRQLADTMK